MFSTGVPDAYLHDFPKDLATVLEGIFARAVLPPLLTRLPTPGNRRYFQARSRMRRTVDHIIALHRAEGADRGDPLSALLNAIDTESRQDEQALTDEEACDQVITFLIAGTETAATTVSWALDLLAQHPEIQQRLHTELDSVLGGADPAYEHLPDLVLTDRVVTETLRLYPAAWLLTRTVTRDTRLGSAYLSSGTSLVYSPYVIQRRPDLYEEPDRFNPDRWHGTRADRTAYLPFAAGARKCIGSRFAQIEATLCLATLLKRWHLAPADGTPVRPAPGLTLTPQRLRLRTTRRRPSTTP